MGFLTLTLTDLHRSSWARSWQVLKGSEVGIGSEECIVGDFDMIFCTV